jgi:hypothetical protein
VSAGHAGVKMSDDPKPCLIIPQNLTFEQPAYEQLQKLDLLPAAEVQKIGAPDSLANFLNMLTSRFSPTAVLADSLEQRAWSLVGLVYRDLRRHYEALSVFRKLYYHMLAGQEQTNSRCHKGMPLCWMSDCYFGIGYPLMSLRYLMLTLVEDAITTQGRHISSQQTGVFWRLVSRGWLSEDDLNRYAGQFYELY